VLASEEATPWRRLEWAVRAADPAFLFLCAKRLTVVLGALNEAVAPAPPWADERHEFSLDGKDLRRAQRLVLATRNEREADAILRALPLGTWLCETVIVHGPSPAVLGEDGLVHARRALHAYFYALQSVPDGLAPLAEYVLATPREVLAGFRAGAGCVQTEQCVTWLHAVEDALLAVLDPALHHFCREAMDAAHLYMLALLGAGDVAVAYARDAARWAVEHFVLEPMKKPVPRNLAEVFA